MITRLRRIYTFFRWELKIPRYLGKYIRTTINSKNSTVIEYCPPGHDGLLESINRDGYSKFKEFDINVPTINIESLIGSARKQTFNNVVGEYWADIRALACNVLNLPQIGRCLSGYFDGKPWLWNISLNYSEKADTQLDSQFWHFDYGDIKQLHIMVYFNDVTVDSGPFTFLPIKYSNEIIRSKYKIERLTDASLFEQYGIDNGKSVSLIGNTGDCFIADPGRLLHQGARCHKPRLVLFLSFTTTSPMSLGGSKTLSRSLRKDLFEFYNRNYKREQHIVYDRNFFF